MDRRDFIKKGIYASAGLLLSNNVSIDARESNKISIKERSAIEKNRSNYKKIEWVLYNNEKGIIHGAQPRANQQSLEQLVFTDKTPERELTEWEITALAKLVPIKKLIEKNSHHYCVNPVWATMFFTYESSLIPIDHNKLSDDYGLGQIKKKSEKLAKELGTSAKSKFYSPDLKKEKSIFDPETNIIMAMLLHRYNIETNNLKNSDQAYATYVNGSAGLKKDGSISDLSKQHIGPFHERYNYFMNIIPFFRGGAGFDKITNQDTKALLEIYNSASDPAEIYQKELAYFLDDLEKNAKGDARSVLVYGDCSTFSRILDLVWEQNQNNNYDRLLKLGNNILKLIDGNNNFDQKVKDELKGMVAGNTWPLLEARKSGWRL
ncbi:MAG: transglycosylase SLT domain-containing protein [Nanoarchaeota archaeon]|nr:transglycosylase SLT domain-containing protein [Nanoarchaeota archaeon]